MTGGGGTLADGSTGYKRLEPFVDLADELLTLLTFEQLRRHFSFLR